MTREDFSAMLVNIRESCGINKKEICRRAKIPFTSIQSIEHHKNNYGVSNIIAYLNAIEVNMLFLSKEVSIIIKDSEDFSKWLLHEKESSGLSLKDLASAVGCASIIIGDIIRNKHKVSIDLMLRLVDYFGYEIKFNPITSIQDQRYIYKYD